MIVFTVLARKHGIATANFAREKRHALVFDGFTVERDNVEFDKILGFDQLRQDGMPVIGGIGRIIGGFLPVIGKLNEAGIFDARLSFFETGKITRSDMR
jgi:hypothetical protein